MQSGQRPLVSIITPTYNSAPYLAETIESVLSQTFQDWEMILTDDCSTDDTVELVTQYSKKDARIRGLVLERNQGPAAARNGSIEAASGRFLAFLDSDDLWAPEKLEIQIKDMMESGCGFSFSNYEIMDSNGRRTGKVVDAKAPMSISYEDYLKKTATIGCLTVVLDRTQFAPISMPPVPHGEDYLLWLDCLKQVTAAKRIDQTLAFYRVLPNSRSRNKLIKAEGQWFCYREGEGLGFFRSCYLMFFYAKNAIFRK